jgi:O-antigen ligase
MLGLACVFLLVAAFLSGARSSWLGMIGLLVLIDWKRVGYIRLLAGAMMILVAAATLLALAPELLLSLRITEATTDLQRIGSGDYNNSIGLRLHLWKAALLMFWSSPLIGIGSSEYHTALTNLIASGAIEGGMFQGEANFNQAHSEMMDALASKGLVGLAAYVILLVLPFRFFSKKSKSNVAEARAFALMGQATIVAFLMFGLTLATFKVQIYCAVFPVTIAVFAAMALNFAETGKQQEKKHG